MRAVYYPHLDSKYEHINLTGEKAKHLIKVVRLKIGEKVLLLDGKGNKAYSEVVELTKKEVVLDIQNFDSVNRSRELDLFIGQVKKDALDLVIKMSVELGVKKLIVGRTKYSQRYDLKDDRVNKLIESAIEQSNNPYFLEYEVQDFTNLDFDQYETVVSFSSIPTKKVENKPLVGKTLLVIGPEGGFSECEEKELGRKSNLKVNIEGPIFRAPTAMAMGIGYILAKMPERKV